MPNKRELVDRFCKLSRRVAHCQFRFREPADCFCALHDDPYFQFSEKVIKFIEEAVEEKLDRDR